MGQEHSIWEYPFVLEARTIVCARLTRDPRNRHVRAFTHFDPLYLEDAQQAQSAGRFVAGGEDEEGADKRGRFNGGGNGGEGENKTE